MRGKQVFLSIKQKFLGVKIMKKALGSFVLFGLLSSGSIAYAQPEIETCEYYNARSLCESAMENGKLAVKKYPKNLNAYYCLAEAYSCTEDFKLAIETMKKAESVAKNKKDLIDIYIKIGDLFKDAGKFDDALLYYNKSLSLAADLKNLSKQVQILNVIASMYESKGELDKALSYYEKSLDLPISGKEKAFIYNEIADMYDRKNQLDKALSYLEKSLDLQIDEKEKAFICRRIADIYDKKGDYQKAANCYQKAIKILEKYRDNLKFFMYKLSLGNIYRKMKDYRNAEKYITEGLEDAKKLRDKYGEAYGYKYFGDLFKDKGDKKTAREYYTRAYNLYKSMYLEKDAQDVLNEIKELDK
jgi:tetratricopeptide (TPR) repeat protein